jgi:uncharacterized protein YjdB
VDTTLGLVPTGYFCIGSNESNGQVFNGRIDEVMYWNRPRTDSEIAVDMNACFTQRTGNLRGYWKFNEGTGASSTDASGNFIFMTLTNATWVTSEPTLGSYAWSFGDGSVSSVNSVARTYSTVGTFVPTLTVTDKNGCRSSASVSVLVKPTPAISSITPTVGNPGSAVTINGSGFNTTPANNIVYFGATRATVTAASISSLTATVPQGGTYVRVTANNAACALTAYSQYAFLPAYNNSSYIANVLNFNSKVDFSAITNPYNVVTSDIDGDGKPDLVVANSPGFPFGSFSIFRNTSSSGTVTFAARVDTTLGTDGTSVATGDLDGDGKPDVVVANYGSSTISVFRNTSTLGTVSFAAKVVYLTANSPRSVAIGDMDGDGKPDIVVACSGSDAVSLHRNTGSPGNVAFAPKTNFATGASPYFVAIADADGDGKPDLAVVNGISNDVSVLRNTSSFGSINFATKVDFAAGDFPRYLAWGDADGDGKPDMAVANYYSNSVSVFRNTGSAGTVSFATKVDYATDSNSTMGDINGDGKPDMAITNSGSANISVFRNTGSSGTISFAPKVNQTTGNYPVGVAIGDIDGDGKPDMSVANYLSASVSVIRNNPFVTPPTVTSVNPNQANPGASINITGTNFNPTPTNNVVYFGATRAIVTAASTNSLTATLPAGASYNKVTVNNTALSLTAYSPLQFLPTYNNSPYVPTTVNFATKTALTTGSGPADVAIGDIDGDGKPEIAVVNSGYFTVSVFRNTGSGTTLSYASNVDFNGAGYPTGIIVGDIDGDGKPDMAVTNAFGSVSAFRNTSTIGTISFAGPIALITGASPVKIAIGDLDGDGRPELITANNGSNSVSVLRNISSIGLFSFASKVDFATGTTPTSVAIADADGDGKPDIAVTNSGSNNVSVYRNTCTPGILSFAAAINYTTGNGPQDVAIGDEDGDGKPDMVVSNSSFGSGSISVFRNTGSSGTVSFAAKVDFTTSSDALYTAVGDVNGDGKPDIVVTDYFTNSVSVFRNTGSSGSISFAARTDFYVGEAPRNIALGDMNSDGMPDIAVTNQYATSVSILRNNPLSGIAGSNTICTGATSTLTNATAGGTWSSSNTSVVTIGTSSGIMSGVSPGTAIITYAGTAVAGFVGNIVTTIVTVNSSPVASTGDTVVCATGSITLSNATVGGTWSSSSTATATVGSGSGVVNGVAAGFVNITYTLGTGCYSVKSLTVTAAMATITGTTNVCVGATSTLSHITPGGTWSSSNAGIATISSAGLVTGISSGAVTMTYMFSTGCYRIKTMTVNPLPSAITGPLLVCVGATTTLTSATGGGISWTSSNTSVANIGSSSGVATGVSSGTAAITYTISTGCTVNAILTVNDSPAAITGLSFVCAGSTINLSTSTAGGTWSSSNTAVGSINTSGMVTGIATGTTNVSYTLATGCRSISIVTVGAIPAPITGTQSVCVGFTTALSSATTGGTWSSGGAGVASIGSTGIVSGISAGTSAISYTNAIGCVRVSIVTVNALPSSIIGVSTICVGSTSALTCGSPGGTWASATVGIATVGSSGVVTGNSIGSTNITYTLVTGCKTITAVTVSASPAAITGATNICIGQTTTFTHPVAGGTWSSSNPALGSVDATTGAITGISAGTPIITYSLAPACFKTKPIAINGGSGAISGNTIVCVGSTTVLSCGTGDSWSSSNTSVASIGITSGVVTGITVGTTDITYTAYTGCINTTVVSVIPLPTAISGTMAFCQGGTTTLLSIGTTGGTWVSSDLGKATIGSLSGVVTGLAGGISNITYTGTNTCKRTAIVTVNPLPVAGVINGAGNVGISTPVTMTTTTAGGAWSLTNLTGTAAITPLTPTTATLTGLTTGTVRVTYTVTNGCGTTFVTRVFTVVTPRPGSKEANVGTDVMFSVYPNPSSGKIMVESSVNGMFKVYTIDGREAGAYEIRAGITNITLLNTLANGIYMCRFNGDDGSTTMARLLYEK